MQAPGGRDEDREGGFEHGAGRRRCPTPPRGDRMHEEFQTWDAYLLGRRTYDIFASFWPDQPGRPVHAGSIERSAPVRRARARSRTADWAGTTILDARRSPQQVAEVKERHERIGLWGSAGLVQTLLRHDLVDRLDLWIYPLAPRAPGEAHLRRRAPSPAAFRRHGSATPVRGAARSHAVYERGRRRRRTADDGRRRAGAPDERELERVLRRRRVPERIAAGEAGVAVAVAVDTPTASYTPSIDRYESESQPSSRAISSSCGRARSSPRASTCRPRSDRGGGSAARRCACAPRGRPRRAASARSGGSCCRARSSRRPRRATCRDDLRQRVELQPQAVLAQLLAGLDERALDVAVLDSPSSCGRPLARAKPRAAGVARVGHGDDEVGAGRRGLAGEDLAHPAARGLQDVAAHARVGPREVDVLEDAERLALALHRPGASAARGR